MRIVHRVERAIEALIVGGVTGTVALVSSLIDGAIGIVGNLSDRLDARLADLARDSNARRQRQGRRPVDPVILR
jgi:hypothetical protein